MLRAVNDRIIVLLDKKIVSSLILSENTTVCNQGRVLDVGPNVKEVHIGDHVVFHQFDELELPREDWVVIRESSVLGTYEE